MKFDNLKVILGALVTALIMIQAGLPELNVSADVRAWALFFVGVLLAAMTYIQANINSDTTV